MRVLLATHYYATHRGGIEIVAGRLAYELVQRGHEVVWAASATDPIPEHASGVECLPMRAWNTIERKSGIPYPLWSPRSVRMLRREAGRADLVHIHDALYAGNRKAIRHAQKHGKPVVITQHIGWIPYNNPALRLALRLANGRIAAPVLRMADQVIFISENTRQYFEGLTDFVRPPVLIPNGVDTETFRPNEAGRREERARFTLPQDRPVLLFVGRFVEKKGLRIIERLARRLSNVHFAFAGWGPLDPSSWNLENTSVFRGYAGATLATLYRSADLLILPSVGEGYPLVVQEAMACGTPVLIGEDTAKSFSPAAEHVFSAKVGGQDTVDAWERRLRELFCSPEELTQARVDVATFAANRWSWKSCADAYDAVFRSLIDAPAG